MNTPHSENSAVIDKPAAHGDRRQVLVPRWVVFFQATFLGIVATTFFVFGLMVGSITTPAMTESNSTAELRISGQVSIRAEDRQLPEAGAVVILLPNPPPHIARLEPDSITPHQFEPLENPVIDSIRGQGGDVVRTNIDGLYDIYAKPGDYHLIIISKTRATDLPSTLSKQQVAALSQYFLPVETLIQKQTFHWQTISLRGESIFLPNVEFQ